MDQRDVQVDEWVALLKQSLHNISKCLQVLQLSRPAITPNPVPTLRVDLGDELIQQEMSVQRQLHPVQTARVMWIYHNLRC